VLALWLAGTLLGSGGAGLAADQPNPPAATHKSTQHAMGEMPASAREHYALAWGIDEMTVRLAESGQLVRFSYRVVDTAKATPLHEKSSSPYLLDEKVHAVLQVPIMEKVGALRQTTPPEPGKSYWMVFSNKGYLVKAGHRVSVMIGQFRVDGLIVR